MLQSHRQRAVLAYGETTARGSLLDFERKKQDDIRL